MTTYSTDPALYIFTSLTAGSSHIVTATSRLETILRANRVPFKAVDIATDEKARMLWGRRAGKDESGRVRKLPGLVQEGLVLGDLVEIEDWNEYGELKMHVKIYQDEFTIPSINDKLPEPLLKRPVTGSAPPAASASSSSTTAAKSTPAPPAPPLPQAKTPAAAATKPKTETKKEPEQKTLPVRSVAEDAAQKAKELRLKSLREKVHGKDGAKSKEAAEKKDDEKPKAATKAEPTKDEDDDDDDSEEEESEEESEEEDDDDDDDDDSDDDSDEEEETTKKPAATTTAAKSTEAAKPKADDAKEKK